MKILTIPSSNQGRSVGDVFLSLVSSPLLANKREPVGYLAHGNHGEVLSFFRKSLDLIMLSDKADGIAKTIATVNAHWAATDVWRQRYPQIQSPWLYFVMGNVAPFQIRPVVPPVRSRVPSKSVVIFPERSDNHRLGDAFFADFIGEAKAQGYAVFTNCFVNGNYATSEPLPGTQALPQLSLTELVAVASDPANIVVGNRSGIFDILYFAMPVDGARLLVIYPPEPAWISETCRFRSDFMQASFPQLYFERKGLVELKAAEFSPAAYRAIFP